MGMREVIYILRDTIIGELNRMCVTDDLAELDTMAFHAKQNLDKLHKLAFSKIKEAWEIKEE